MSKEVPERRDSSEAAAADDTPDQDGVRMVLWTRRPVCGPRTEIIDRLGRLQSDGVIGGFRVETWPDEIAISEHTRHSRVVETYERFRDWADRAGVGITPPFDHRTVTSLVGRTEEVLTLPVLCLAVHDDDLCGVYPCTDGDRTWTVTDYLEACADAGGHPATGDSPIPTADQ